MNTPVIFVIGPPGHGKTAARKILADLTSQKGESTSTAIMQFLGLRRGLDKDALKKLPKEEIRKDLIEAGDFMVGSIAAIAEKPVDAELDNVLYRVPSALVRMLYLNGNNIIDGVRRTVELSDAKKHLEWNGVPHLTLWIEKSQGPVIPDNTELTALEADETVYNDGTLEELKEKLLAVLVKHYGPQDELQKPLLVAGSPGEAAESVKDDLG